MSDTKFEQLKLLHDYTKFHIALYATLITALLSVMSFGGKALPIELIDPLKVTIVAFVLAGACGGIVASSSVRFESIDAFRKESISPFGWKWFPGKVWASTEHFFFWFGIAYAVFHVVAFDPATLNACSDAA